MVPLDHFRIDDRLVHGQVVVGWGQPLALGFLVLVDDAVAASDWECELCRAGTPPGMELFVESVATAAARFPEFQSRADDGMLVTSDVATMGALCSALPAIRAVTIGGLHHGPGRSPRLSYVFLSDADVAGLTEMTARGVRVVAQDLPGTHAVPLDELLRGRGA